MSYRLTDLLAELDLEEIEKNIYRGTSRDIGTPAVFGGQVLAQSLVAAARTVGDERTAHSMHGYFILPGDVTSPIVYFVDSLRDGKSFTTRRVTAIQHGRAIFNMAASFHVAEDGPAHQAEMPDVPPPEALADELERVRAAADRIPEPRRRLFTQDRPFELRRVGEIDLFRPEPQPPVRHAWVRAAGAMPDSLVSHQSVLAYASDYGLLGTALLPHGLSFNMRRLQAASLDHAIWFHRPFRADEWLLFTSDSPSAGGARGFARGSVFTREGVLVASVVQEGLLRLHD